MIDQILSDAFVHLLEQSPALAIVGIVAYYLRRDLRDCIDSQKQVLNRLLDRTEK